MSGQVYRDVFDFQKQHPSKEERERVLKTMSGAEILRIAESCGTKQGAGYYGRYAREAMERENMEKEEGAYGGRSDV